VRATLGAMNTDYCSTPVRTSGNAGRTAGAGNRLITPGNLYRMMTTFFRLG
jgi:hypothetical protein